MDGHAVRYSAAAVGLDHAASVPPSGPALPPRVEGLPDETRAARSPLVRCQLYQNHCGGRHEAGTVWALKVPHSEQL